MEGMGLKFTSVIERHLLHHLSMFRPMAGNSGTHRRMKGFTMVQWIDFYYEQQICVCMLIRILCLETKLALSSYC